METRNTRADSQRITIHMAIRDIYMAMSSRRRLLCALGYPSSCLCIRGVQLVDLVTTKCMFSRKNTMRSTLLASMLLRRSPMGWPSAEKLRSAWWMWVVMPDVPSFSCCPLMESTS